MKKQIIIEFDTAIETHCYALNWLETVSETAHESMSYIARDVLISQLNKVPCNTLSVLPPVSVMLNSDDREKPVYTVSYNASYCLTLCGNDLILTLNDVRTITRIPYDEEDMTPYRIAQYLRLFVKALKGYYAFEFGYEIPLEDIKYKCEIDHGGESSHPSSSLIAAMMIAFDALGFIAITPTDEKEAYFMPQAACAVL